MIQLRNAFYTEVGKKRWKRVVFCTLVIAIIWDFADWLSGSYQLNLWHDFICLGLGIISERFVSWGKIDDRSKTTVKQATHLIEKVKEDNNKLLETVVSQNEIIKKYIKDANKSN